VNELMRVVITLWR